MAGIEQEDAIVQQFLRGQPLAIVLALDQPRQHVALGIAGFCAPPLDQRFEIGEKILHRLVAARKHLRADDRLERAENRQRPVAQRLALVMGHVEQIADHLDRDRGGKILDQVDLALGGEAIEQPVDQPDQVGSISAIARGDSAPMISRRTRVCAGGSLKTRLVVWCS